MAIFGYELEPGEEYLYHYTSSTTLALILDSGTLRFGEYARTNDPRENREWLASMSMGANFEDEHGELDYFSFARALDVAIRRRTRVACLTMDRSPSAPASGTAFHRGWGRARMWSQYGENHRGACLVFDRRSLDQAVMAAMSGMPLWSRAVRYSDGLEATPRLHVPVENLVERGVGQVADDIVAARGGELFFNKNEDWLTETEYRYVVVGEEVPEFVGVKSCLAGVVVGTDFPSHELSVLGNRLDRLARPDLLVGRVRWLNGAPSIDPVERGNS